MVPEAPDIGTCVFGYHMHPRVVVDIAGELSEHPLLQQKVDVRDDLHGMDLGGVVLQGLQHVPSPAGAQGEEAAVREPGDQVPDIDVELHLLRVGDIPVPVKPVDRRIGEVVDVDAAGGAVVFVHFDLRRGVPVPVDHRSPLFPRLLGQIAVADEPGSCCRHRESREQFHEAGRQQECGDGDGSGAEQERRESAESIHGEDETHDPGRGAEEVGTVQPRDVVAVRLQDVGDADAAQEVRQAEEENGGKHPEGLNGVGKEGGKIEAEEEHERNRGHDRQSGAGQPHREQSRPGGPDDHREHERPEADTQDGK